MGMITFLRHAVVLLLFGLAPLASDAVMPATMEITASCGQLGDGAIPGCDPHDLPAAMHREVEDRTRIFWSVSALVLLVVTGGLTWLIRQPSRRRRR